MNSLTYLKKIHDHKNISYFPLQLTDPPSIQTIADQSIRAGGNLSINCRVSSANPLPHRYTWIKVNDGTFSQTGPVLVLPNIQLRNAGTYRCTAVNTMLAANGSRQQGADTEDVVVDVLCMYTDLLLQHAIIFSCTLIMICKNYAPEIEYSVNQLFMSDHT